MSDLTSTLAELRNDRSAALLVVLAYLGAPSPVDIIRSTAIQHGLPKAKTWNISNILSRNGSDARRTSEGWTLTEAGKTRTTAFWKSTATSKVSHPLKQHLNTISNPQVRQFLEEAVACLEHKLFRSAVVLSWIGAVAVLYEFTLKHHLSEFNAEAIRRDSNRKPAKTFDDLAMIKESVFLDIIHSISVIGKSTKKELNNCLDRRNGCGHPNTYKIGDHGTAAHIEFLMQNVFEKFGA